MARRTESTNKMLENLKALDIVNFVKENTEKKRNKWIGR